MKKYLLIFSIAAAALFAASCQKTSEGHTYIANYFQFNGAEKVYLAVGDEYTDAGVTEMEGGGKVVTTITDMNGEEVSAVSTDTPGFFDITYSTVNDQGWPFSMSRTVYVYDATVTETLGTFTVDCDASWCGKYTYAERVAASVGSGMPATTNYTIKFTQVAGNIYTCSDLLGGWYTYAQGRGPYYAANYGSSYATYFDMTGYVTLNADMTVTVLSSYIRCWGDGLDFVKNAVYDPATKTLTYDFSYASSVVVGHVEMSQN